MAAVFVAEGCARALKRETDLGVGRAEILALEEQWATNYRAAGRSGI